MKTQAVETTAARPASRRAVLMTCLTALFAALTAGGALVSIPVPLSPVPIVLQNLFAVLSGLVLGPLFGAAAAALFLLAGALGMPVFSGASGGIAHIVGPTGGFLIGYALAAFVAGLIAGTPRAAKPAPLVRIVAAGFAGFLAVYLLGVPWLKMVAGYDWGKAIAGGFVPFIPGDLIKLIAASAAVPRLRRTLAGLLDN